MTRSYNRELRVHISQWLHLKKISVEIGGHGSQWFHTLKNDLNINTSNVLLFKGLLGKTALMGQYNGHDSLHF